jgi:DNA-binding NtrC family response regulator
MEEQPTQRGGASFSLSTSGENALLGYAWPGNIRELRHCIERACVMATEPVLTSESLFPGTPLPDPPPGQTGDTLIAHLDACEKRYLEQVLGANAWRIGTSAAALGVSRKTLWQKMRKHGISEPENE